MGATLVSRLDVDLESGQDSALRKEWVSAGRAAITFRENRHVLFLRNEGWLTGLKSAKGGSASSAAESL